MAEISKISRAVEMPPVKRTAFVNLIKTCDGVAAKSATIVDEEGKKTIEEGKENIYMSEKSTILDSDIRGEIDKCSHFDSGLTKAIMLLYGRPDLGNIDYGSLDISNPKDQGTIVELRSVLDEDKLSEAISLAQEMLDAKTITDDKWLEKGIENVKRHIQAFRPVWQVYQNYAEPLVERSLAGRNTDKEKEQRIPRSEIESAFDSDQNRIASIEEEIGRKTEDLERLQRRVVELRRRNEERAEILGKTIGETKQKVEEVVGGRLFQFPQKPGRPANVAQEIDITPAGGQLVADMVTGNSITEKTKEKDGEAEGKLIPLRTAKKEIPDDIA